MNRAPFVEVSDAWRAATRAAAAAEDADRRARVAGALQDGLGASGWLRMARAHHERAAALYEEAEEALLTASPPVT